MYDLQDSGRISDIAQLIRAWVEREVTPTEETALIRVAAEVVLLRLRSRLGIASRLQGYDHAQLALWAVTPLFAAGAGRESALGKSWFSAPPPQGPAANIAWFESRVVQTAKHELQRLIAEEHPFEYRLRRRLLHAFRQSQQLFLFPSKHPEYVCLRGEKVLREDLPRVTLSEIRAAVAAEQTNTGALKELIRAVVTNLSQRTDRCGAIPLWELCEVLTEYGESIAARELQEAARDKQPGSEFTVQLQDAVVQSVSGIDGILEKYVRLRRLMRPEAGIMRAAVATYLERLATDAESVGLAECIQEHEPDLTTAGYRTKYAKMFEYVVSIARRHFSEYWRR